MEGSRILDEHGRRVKALMEVSDEVFHLEVNLPERPTIQYDRDRDPVLMDFGLASCHGNQLCNGGTPWYVPWEFIDNSGRGPESDVFALGVTMLIF
ncbi:Fc.00g036100.m01.CDS01 [Cosmosporella sp. VM-42]